ncbi:MAG: FAD-dependent monooxygenase [Pseudomonadales bacterium]
MSAPATEGLDSNIAIVGAGLAGLALAIALRNSGIENVTLFEQRAPEALATAPSTPIMLPPNATRVLRALGLRAELERIAYQPRSLQQRGGTSGFLMSELPLGDLAVNRYGAPYLVADYEALRSIMLAQAHALGVTIEFSRTCVGRQRQRAIFNDTNSHSARLLVGADGVSSVLRDSLAAASQQLPGAGWQWSGQLPLEAVPESLQALALTLWLGNRGYVSHCVTADQKHWYWRACLLQHNQEQPSALLDAFGGWQPMLVKLLADTREPRREALRQCEAATALHDGGFALIGDAGHPIAPHLEQDAGLALEDAWVLSRFIDQLEHDPVAACGEYQRFRLKRVQLMAQRAQAEGARRAAGASMSRALDRAKVSLTSRFLPELAMQRLDWMYRYDCIRGFE